MRNLIISHSYFGSPPHFTTPAFQAQPPTRHSRYSLAIDHIRCPLTDPATQPGVLANTMLLPPAPGPRAPIPSAHRTLSARWPHLLSAMFDIENSRIRRPTVTPKTARHSPASAIIPNSKVVLSSHSQIVRIASLAALGVPFCRGHPSTLRFLSSPPLS